MNILEKLASASGQRSQDLNIDLAKQIANNKDKEATKELVDGLANKAKAIRHDCIKTLYEIGAINAGLLKPHFDIFIDLLKHKDNRMQWGTMTVLSALSKEMPEEIFNHLSQILSGADNGSVITTDHWVKILVTLSTHPEYSETTIPLLLDQILKSPINQLPSYAEQALPVVGTTYTNQFKRILSDRLTDVEPESKRKRVEKIFKKL